MGDWTAHRILLPTVSLVWLLAANMQPALAQQPRVASEGTKLAQLRQDFGEQIFVPHNGFVLSLGQTLPDLVWQDPDRIANHFGHAPIRTRGSIRISTRSPQ